MPPGRRAWGPQGPSRWRVVSGGWWVVIGEWNASGLGRRDDGEGSAGGMGEPIFYSVLLRVAEALLQSAPFVLCGVVVAAVFRRFLGPDNTRRLFGGGGFRGLVLGWLLGMLLPVCSLGALPVIREMRRAGLPGGTILAFALAAPLFNPLSLLYGLTLSAPFTILAFALCTLVLVTLVGAAWDRWFPGTAEYEPPPPGVPYGLRRIASLVTAMARDCSDRSLGLVVVGLLGVALLAAVLPPGSLQRSANHDRPLAPLVMTTVALPAYATPMLAMSQLGMMFQHGNSVGAAFVLLVLGAGMNLGTVAWMVGSYGWKRAGGFLLLLLTVVLVLSYGIERPLFPRGTDLADHTHAFDGYCQAYQPGSTDLARQTLDRLRQNAQFFELTSLKVLGGLCLLGGLLRGLKRWWDVEAWLERPLSTAQALGRYDRIVSPATVGGAMLLGLFAFSLVGCYAYYPPPQEVFEEIYVAKGEALGSALAGEVEHCERWIEILDDWTRKLEVGVYLRQGELPEYHRARTRLFRDQLELLEHEVQDGDREATRALVTRLSKSLKRLQRAYLSEL